MTDWFRSWHGAPTDPKWLGIAKRAGVAPGIAVAVAWALMDRASQASERGSIDGYDAEGLAYFFGCEPDQVDAIVAAMSNKGMIEDGRFANWEKRQPKREDDSSQRVREHRKRNAEQAKRDVTQRNAPDTETEEDTENKPQAQQPQSARGDAAAAWSKERLDRLEAAARKAAKLDQAPSPGLMDLSPLRGLIDAGFAFEADIAPVLAEVAARGYRRQPGNWAYFEQAIRERAEQRTAVAARPKPVKATISDEDWRKRVRAFRAGSWAAGWGPQPGDRGCVVPPHILAEQEQAA